MDVGRALRQARRRAGLTQRELARRAGIAQSAIARIESGRVIPRVDTFEGLLRVAGEELRAHPRLGVGVDRSLIASHLERSPRERIEHMANAAAAIEKLRAATKRSRKSK